MIFGEALYFIALAAAVVAFRFAPGKLRPWLIFICGLAFYGYYAGRFWLLILGEALLVYMLGRTMRRPRIALPAFAIGLASTIGALAYFKYSRLLGPILGQALGSHGSTLPSFQDIAVPLAISFFTFEFIHYVVDIRRGTIERHGLGDFLAFAMFAPTMVAGPIKRFQQFSPQVLSARADASDVSAGVTRIAVGLAKKMVLADTFARWRTMTEGGSEKLPLAPSLRRNTPFDRLDPARQTEIVERYANFANFHLQKGDSELRMLDLLCARLERRHANAFFFMSPLNLGALEGFGVFDHRLYSANVAIIRAVVEKHGLTFIDWNQPRKELPSSLFADATHTTDHGSAVFARRLYRALAPQLAVGERP